MKKRLLLLVLLPVVCFGKNDICRKISKNYTREKGVRVASFQSPALLHITAIKQIKGDTVFALNLHLNDYNQHFEGMGAAVEFEDGTVLTDDDVKVHCQQEAAVIDGSSSGMSRSGRYMMQGFFYISDDNRHTFTTRKIVRVRLHDTWKNIPQKEASRIISYLKCMETMKR